MLVDSHFHGVCSVSDGFDIWTGIVVEVFVWFSEGLAVHFQPFQHFFLFYAVVASSDFHIEHVWRGFILLLIVIRVRPSLMDPFDLASKDLFARFAVLVHCSFEFEVLYRRKLVNINLLAQFVGHCRSGSELNLDAVEYVVRKIHPLAEHLVACLRVCHCSSVSFAVLGIDFHGDDVSHATICWCGLVKGFSHFLPICFRPRLCSVAVNRTSLRSPNRCPFVQLVDDAPFLFFARSYND